MKGALLGLLAETPLHPGTGRSVGVIDLPVARESATSYPVIYGSGVKGALREEARRRGWIDDLDIVFGHEDKGAGSLLISDARLLLLPVRSLSGAYRWVTCPYLLERFRRDLRRLRIETGWDSPRPGSGEVVATGSGEHLFLEERRFVVRGEPSEDLVGALEPLIAHKETRGRLPSQLAIVADGEFGWFARYALEIRTRNRLKEESKMSENLWQEESLPTDTLLYVLLTPRSDSKPVDFGAFWNGDPYMQVGGNETVGQGWVAVSVVPSRELEGSEVGT